MSSNGFQLVLSWKGCQPHQLKVDSEKPAQSYGVLHGGISAFLAESLGSQGLAPVIFSQHLLVWVTVTPMHIGRRLQVNIKLDPYLVPY